MLRPYSVFCMLVLSCLCAGSASAEKINLRYDGSAQIVIRSPAGRSVMIDVALPKELKITPGPSDILLTIHCHPDHWNRSFQSTFPGEQLLMKKGPIFHPDVAAAGIRSAHHPKDPVGEDSETNWIYLVVAGGLRIAHFGDIGQECLSDEQLKHLGRVDVAIMQFANPRCEMTVENRLAFKLMLQLHSRLIIPTAHAGLMALRTAREYWACFALDQQEVALEPAKLPEQTSLLVIGNLAALALEELGYKPWPNQNAWPQ